MPRNPGRVAGSPGPRYAGPVKDTSSGLEIGSVFAGCRVERLLGRGTGGSVYLARRPGGEAVVLKLLAPGLARDPEARARFLREWEALSKLRPHPNLMRVHEVHDGERPSLVAEHVPGQALDVLLRQGPLAPRRAAEIARDMALGLGAVHALGLLHRDVKPANAIVAAEGPAKVVDFGLAKDLFRTGLTQPGQILGTVLYMAPEVWEEEEEPDARADVFSLGATLYELLVGRPPFLGDDPSEVADAVLDGDYRLLAEAAPHVPQELDFVVRQMLAIEPRERYGRMEEVARDLDAVLDGRLARVPALSDGAGRRWPLLPGPWFTLGSAETCQVVLPDAGPSQAEIRRGPEGFVLRDLGSAGGTQLDGLAVQPGAARALAEGARLRVGLHELTFTAGAAAREGGASYRADVERVQAPLEVCQALARARDPRAALYLLERLAPDPGEAERARAILEPRLGAAATEAVLARRDPNHGHGTPEAISALLGEITGGRVEGPLGWLSWWRQVRLSAPIQVGPGCGFGCGSGFGAPAVLQSSNGFALPLGASGVVLVGRDERCALRLPPPAPRLRATLLRLHRRWILLAEGAPISLGGAPCSAGFLDPGQVASLGQVQLRLEVSGSAELGLDPTTFRALWSLAHPATLAFALGLLSSSRSSQELGPSAQESEEALRGVARERLTQALGPGDPEVWRGSLARGVLVSGEPLPAQLFPESGLAS